MVFEVSDLELPRHADGQPFKSDVVAVIDETTPQVQGGTHYVVTASVILDPDAILVRLENLFVGRTRPFHWHQEGIQKKTAMIELIEEVGVVAHARYLITAPKKQKHARNELIPAIAADAYREGAAHLIIEGSDSTTEGRDRHALLNAFETEGGVPFEYDHRTKKEHVLGVADAVCGTIRGHLTGEEPEWFPRLQQSGVISELQYGV